MERCQILAPYPALASFNRSINSLQEEPVNKDERGVEQCRLILNRKQNNLSSSSGII